MVSVDTAHEAMRQLEVCNACRYCEGYCAVFPALERRRILKAGDLDFLANLCHDCRACFHACMFSPPHQFAVNIPKTLANIRTESYATYSTPAVATRIVRGNGLLVGAITVLMMGLLALGVALAAGKTD